MTWINLALEARLHFEGDQNEKAYDDLCCDRGNDSGTGNGRNGKGWLYDHAVWRRWHHRQADAKWRRAGNGT